MKTIAAVLLLAGLIGGCSSKTSDSGPGPAVAPALPSSSVPPAPAPEPMRTHHYVLKDGFEYGYERPPSKDEQDRGIATGILMMVKYAGERNGVHQVYSKDQATGAVSVIECSDPCEFMKVMVFAYPQGGALSVQRLRAAPGIMGAAIMEDAIGGELQQYFSERNGKSFSIWFDEKKGLLVTPVQAAQ